MRVSKRTICAVVLAGMLGLIPSRVVFSAPEPGEMSVRYDGWASRALTVPLVAASFHPEHLLVRFKAGKTRSDRQAVHAAAQAKGIIHDYHAVDGLQLVQVANDRLTAALNVYENHPDVLYAEPDYCVYAADVPNDPDFLELWGMLNIGQTVNGDPGTPGADIRASDAWDIWTGDADFTIAVIDTGVNYTHPDLQANMWVNPGEIPGNRVDDDGNGYVDDVHGFNFVLETGDPMDDHYHGTHVAGTIGAVGNNGLGVAGVNWQCQIMALKFLDAAS